MLPAAGLRLRAAAAPRHQHALHHHQQPQRHLLHAQELRQRRGRRPGRRLRARPRRLLRRHPDVRHDEQHQLHVLHQPRLPGGVRRRRPLHHHHHQVRGRGPAPPGLPGPEPGPARRQRLLSQRLPHRVRGLLPPAQDLRRQFGRSHVRGHSGGYNLRRDLRRHRLHRPLQQGVEHPDHPDRGDEPQPRATGLPAVLPGHDRHGLELQLRHDDQHEPGCGADLAHRHSRDGQPGLHRVRAAGGGLLQHRVEPARRRPVLLHGLRGHGRPGHDGTGNRGRRVERRQLRRRLHRHPQPLPEPAAGHQRPLLRQRPRHHHFGDKTVLADSRHQQHRARDPAADARHREPWIQSAIQATALSDHLEELLE